MIRRPSTPYGQSAVTPVHVAGAVEIAVPVAGHFRHRLRSGGVFGGVRLWHGPPLDPVTGEELDRGWRWQAHFNGVFVELDDVWPVCAGDPITEGEYRTYCNRQRWAEQHAPQSAYADPRKRIDPLSSANPLPF